MKLYTTKEIQDMTEVTGIQLSEWIKAGAIKPFIGKNKSGGIPMFDLENLIDINLCRELCELRLPNHVISACLKQLHSFGSLKFRFGFGYDKHEEKRKSFWNNYLRTYETKRWYLMIVNRQNTAGTNKITNIFLKVYKNNGVTLPNDMKDIFLVLPVPKEKLLSVFEFANLAIVLNLDEIVDRVVDKFSLEEIIYNEYR